VKGRTVFKWATGVVAIVVLIGVGAVVLLFVVGFMSLEKGEKHRREFQAELDSGRWILARNRRCSLSRKVS
jgi:NADH:ubiquinone oxidoreductase subunit 6 (subunit J)